MTSITAAACAALLIGTTVAAQPADRSTFVTFSAPVSIPGKTLPAGTYTFRLADSPADRHIVQIFNQEQSQLLATLLAVPAERNQPEGDPLITFRETPANMPPAVRYWYYAGEKSGNEFVYPKTQAMAIARASGESVMSMDTESTDVNDWKGTPTRVTANAEPTTATTASTTSTTTQSSTAQPAASPATTQPTTTPAEPTEPAAAQPTTTQPTTSRPSTTQPSTTQPSTASPDRPEPSTTRPTTTQPTGTSGRAESTELPRTAGELPTAGLIALLAFAGAVALRAARKAVV
jgi:Protein of unknown function (DUF2911)